MLALQRCSADRQACKLLQPLLQVVLSYGAESDRKLGCPGEVRMRRHADARPKPGVGKTAACLLRPELSSAA